MTELELEPGWLERQIADTKAEVATWPPEWTCPDFKLGDIVQDDRGFKWRVYQERRHYKGDVMFDLSGVTHGSWASSCYPNGEMLPDMFNRRHRIVRKIEE